jgi:hypothetical protein
VESTIDVKHEDSQIAYKARPIDRSFQPAPPSWLPQERP